MARKPTGAKTGRPSKYHPSFCDRVLEFGREGKSVAYMAAKLGVARNTLELNWPASHPEFAEALEQARLESQAWWEDFGQTNMTVTGFSASAYIRSMAARFPNDWRETHRAELTGADGAPLGGAPEVDVEGLTPDELKILAKIKLRKGGEGQTAH